MPITLAHSGSVATIQTDRQERRNALNAESLDELDAAVATAVAGGARALILTAPADTFAPAPISSNSKTLPSPVTSAMFWFALPSNRC